MQKEARPAGFDNAQTGNNRVTKYSVSGAEKNTKTNYVRMSALLNFVSTKIWQYLVSCRQM